MRTVLLAVLVAACAAPLGCGTAWADDPPPVVCPTGPTGPAGTDDHVVHELHALREEQAQACAAGHEDAKTIAAVLRDVRDGQADGSARVRLEGVDSEHPVAVREVDPATGPTGPSSADVVDEVRKQGESLNASEGAAIGVLLVGLLLAPVFRGFWEGRR